MAPMIPFREWGSKPRRALCLFWTAALLFVCLCGFVGCSGEVYDPNGETLSLSEATAEVPTGSVLEIPSGDPFADSPHVLRADFLNTGKSDAILLRTDGSVILVDTGEADDYGIISGKLAEYGITAIDSLIITHFDSDHIGSAAQILQNYAVKAVYMPDYVRDSVPYRRMMSTLEALPDVAVYRVTENLTMDLPYGSLQISPTKLYEAGLTLGSDDSHAAEENNYSLITSMEFGEISLLLAGDAEQDRLTEYMAASGGYTAYDLIKIPHHGSYDKALGDLLRLNTGLRYCVVHVDSAAEVEAGLVTAMRSAGAAAYYTYNGDIAFSTDGTSMVVEQN